MRRGVLTLLLPATLAAMLAACGSDRDGEAMKKTATAKDCPMTAAAAGVVRQRLQARRRSSTEAQVIVHEIRKKVAVTSTDDSPDDRDVFILINDEPGVAGLVGTAASKSGSTTIELKARQGCGAVAYVRHKGTASARFTLNGRETGGTGPAEE